MVQMFVFDALCMRNTFPPELESNAGISITILASEYDSCRREQRQETF